jgi:hypothetical protein
MLPQVVLLVVAATQPTTQRLPPPRDKQTGLLFRVVKFAQLLNISHNGLSQFLLSIRHCAVCQRLLFLIFVINCRLVLRLMFRCRVMFTPEHIQESSVVRLRRIIFYLNGFRVISTVSKVIPINQAIKQSIDRPTD